MMDGGERWTMSRPFPARNSVRGGRPGTADSLLAAFLRSDEEALSHVTVLIENVVRFRGYYVPVSEQPDLVQDAVAQVWQAATRTGFNVSESFGAFVETVAMRRCVDWMRRERLRATQRDTARPEMVERRSGPAEDLIDKERQSLCAQVLQRLGEPCRQLIQCVVIDQMSYREVAAQFGQSEHALRTRMWSCLRSARRILDRLSNPPNVTRPLRTREGSAGP